MPDSRLDAAPGPGRVRRFTSGLALPAAFYDRPADVVARELLGATLVSEVGGVRCGGEIVETEAYTGPEDEASHAHLRFGQTPRNRAMFGPPGRAYVYRIYGVHWCLNAVTGSEEFPAAVLFRAIHLSEGIEVARQRRSGRTDRELARGPGNLARALGVDGSLYGHALDQAPLWIEPGRTVPDEEVASGPRIGISRATDLPLRFWLRGNPCVSGRAGVRAERQ